MSRGLKIGIGVGILAVVAVGATMVIRNRRDPGIEVQTTTIARRDLTAHVLANGKLQPRNKVDISANIPGQIVNLAVREGDSVEKGAFLLQIDKTQYQASAESSEAFLQSLLHDRDAAEATLEQARYDFEAARRSYDDRIIPEQEFQRARSAMDAAAAAAKAAAGRVEQARASLEGARDSLNKTTIRAPLAGMVTSLPVHEGEVAVIGTMNNPGTVLMTISDLGSMEADLAVDETDLPRLQVGQRATLQIEAYPDEEFHGVVREVGSSPIRPGSDAATRTGSTTTEAIDFEVKVTLENPPASIRPGFSVTAEIETGHVEGVPAVPIQALVTREAPSPGSGPGKGKVEEGVYRLDGSVVRFVPLETGLAGELEIEALDGVQEGDVIVTGPFRALRQIEDGDTVRVARSAEPGAGRGETPEAN
ncbi:MAG: efflux RND transporter periplasmic adaptor subunit [Acidobacteriota bacterium]|jgi:HlyD family secretion protein